MRLFFLGSGDFGLPTLQALHAHHSLAAVVTQPDRPAGRKRKLTPTPIGRWARDVGLEVIKCEDANTPEMVERVRQLHVEAGVVVAFGQKLSPSLIAASGELAINLHASLLPKFRGAAPINWAIIDGEARTGVSVIALARRMDAGAVYATAATDIAPDQTAGELHDRLAQLGPDAVLGVLDDLAHDQLAPVEQDESLTCKAPKFTKADGTVSFDQPAVTIRNRIHGLTPWPGCRMAWTCQATGKTQPLTLRRASTDPPSELRAASPGTVLDDMGRVAAADGVVRLIEVQAPGGKPMAMGAFARGRGFGKDDTLTPITS